MRAFVLVTIAAVALAGCLNVKTAGVAPSASEAQAKLDALGGFPDPMLMGSSHKHSDASQHKLSTPTMKMLAHVDYGDSVPTAAFSEADLLGKDWLVHASFTGGFYIDDIKDRAHPKVVSFTPTEALGTDVKGTESGNLVFMASQMIASPTGGGVTVWNTMVKERPVLVGFFPIAGESSGCHMLAYHKGYLYCSPNDNTVRILKVDETPGAVVLTPAGMYAPKDQPMLPVYADRSTSGNNFTHDMTVQDDPITGQPVMFVSFWDYGVRVVDVKDPAKPKEIGHWAGEGAESTFDGNIHTTMSALVDGKRIIATIPEYSQTPSVTFLDATDYAHITVIGVWAPHTKEDFGNQNENPSTFSTHNFQFLKGRVYIAMYHGGVWVLDASSVQAMAHPRALGYYLPSEPKAAAASSLPNLLGGAPNAWDVLLKDGTIYVSDIPTGLYALHYEGDPLGDATYTSSG